MHRSALRIVPTSHSTLGWVAFLRRRSFCVDSRSLCWLFHTSRSIRSTRIPAWLLRTWQRYATMAVSICTCCVPCTRLIGVLQHSPSQLCCPKIHTRGQVGSTTAICANATRSCTTLLAHAMRARERRGSCALTSYAVACILTNRPSCNTVTLSGRLTAPPQQLPECESQSLFY